MPEVLPLSASRKDLRLSFDKIVKSADRATIAALNRTADRGRTLAVREMQRDLGASSQKTLRDAVTVDRATSAKAVAFIEARGKRIPIIELNPKPRTVSKRRRGVPGVTWGAKNRLIAGSFIAKLVSGHTGVFKRRGKERLPIDELKGPSAAKVFSNRSVQTPVRALLRDFFPQEFKRLLSMRIAG